MLDHIGIALSDYARSKRFYTAALAPLGVTLIMEPLPEQTGSDAGACGFGTVNKPFFWIGAPSGTMCSISHVWEESSRLNWMAGNMLLPGNTTPFAAKNWSRQDSRC